MSLMGFRNLDGIFRAPKYVADAADDDPVQAKPRLG